MRLHMILPSGRLLDVLISQLNTSLRTRHWPNVKNPLTLNEIILSQKFRFAGDLSLARILTDKFEVKSWLEGQGLGELVVPTIGIFDNREELEKATFKEEFIVKSTHGSGGVIICDGRSGHKLNMRQLRSVDLWLSEDYYKRSREPNYEGLKRRVIVEPIIRDECGLMPKDFKIFCYKGNPFIIQVDIGRFENHTRQLYDLSWNLLPYSMGYPRHEDPIEKPRSLEKALDFARILSGPFGFVRVDLYLMEDMIKLGELTFFPGNGAERFTPVTGDRALGDMARNAALQVRAS